LIIEHLTLFNWQGYYGKYKFNFKGTGGRSSAFIYADNTVGKSAFWEAVAFVLYGRVVKRRQPEQTKPFVKEHSGEHPLMNTDLYGQKGSYFGVELSFSHRDSQYRLYRGFKPKFDNKPVTLSTDLKEDLVLENESERGNDRFVKDVNTWIEQNILPHRLSKFFLFDGERLEDYEDLMRKDEDLRLRADIEDILRSPILREGQNQFKYSMHRFQTERGKANLEAQKNKKKKALYTMKEKDHISVKSELKAVTTEIKGYTNEIEEINDWLEENDRSKEAAILIRTTAAEVKQIGERITDLRNDIVREMRETWKILISDNVNKAKATLEGQKKDQQDHLDELVRIEKSISDENDALEGNKCSSCNKPREVLTEEKKKLTKQRITDLKLEYKNHESAAEFPSLDVYYKRLNGLSELQTTDSNLSDLIAKEDQLVEQIEKLKISERDHQKALLLISEDTNLEVRKKFEEKDKVEGKKKLAEIELSKYEDIRRGLEEELRKLLVDSNDNPEHESTKERRLVKSTKIAESLCSLFENSLSEFMETMRESVETKASETFLQVSNNSDNYNGLAISSEFTVSIKDKKDHPDAGSPAQSLVMAYSIIDALSTCSGFEFPMIVDTPARGLASKNSEAVYDFFTKAERQVIFLPNDLELDPDKGDDKYGSRVASTYELVKIDNDRTKVKTRINNLE